MTFVCNARFAMEYVQAYLKSVQDYQKKICQNGCTARVQVFVFSTVTIRFQEYILWLSRHVKMRRKKYTEDRIR